MFLGGLVPAVVGGVLVVRLRIRGEGYLVRRRPR
jgi:hypothetical protein